MSLLSVNMDTGKSIVEITEKEINQQLRTEKVQRLFYKDKVEQVLKYI